MATATSQTEVSSIISAGYLTQHDLEQIQDWNSRPLDRVNGRVHDFIYDQVGLRAQNEAICSWDGSFTYADLDDLSSRLAGKLTELGVQPGIFVPLCFPKSAFTVISMLAVLKAGGAFVCLDPSHPKARLQSLLHRVNGTLVLCDESSQDHFTGIVEQTVLVTHETLRNMSLEVEIPQIVTPDDPAYLIFTSGTTGEPKGTVISHSAYCSMAMSYSPMMLLNSECRALQFASYTFDACLIEILSTLIVGGCVCVPSEYNRLNNISTAINEMHVNWACLTPSFVRFIDPSSVPGLDTLILAGEAMSKSHLTTWSHKNLVNAYGPSECSVCSVVNNQININSEPSNIGFPAGVHCWVVDIEDFNRLVSVGNVGELLIEGHTLAIGYLGDEEKTNQSFIENPEWATSFENTASRRMYLTGDLVRQNYDGSLTYIGRKDTQVKVGGQRVELGEILHHIEGDENIKHALVLYPKKGVCQQRLVSIVSFSNRTVSTNIEQEERLQLLTGASRRACEPHLNNLRKKLCDLLPAHMVPSIWLVVNSMPFLPSGKLDRRSVSSWVDNCDADTLSQVAAHQESYVAATMDRPLTETELKLREIWSHVLNLHSEQIGMHASFLSLGGDSISAMAVRSQCQKHGIGVTVQDVLRSKSLIDLATHAKAADLPSFHEDPEEQPWDLSPIQQGFFDLPENPKGHFNQSFFLRLTRVISKDVLQQAIESVIEHHSMLRSRFNQTTNGWEQRVTREIKSSYRLLSHNISQTTDAHPAMADSQKALDPVHGPLFAADLFHVDGSDQLLFMVGHHLVIDLVSWRVILQDIEELLDNLDSAKSLHKTLPFQTWCRMQAEHAQRISLHHVLPRNDVPAGDIEFWGMSGLPNVYGDVIYEGFELSPQITSLLLSQANHALRTEIVDILIASLVYSFSQVFTQRQVPAIFAEGHGREPWDPSIDISRTVGWFTTMYPIFISASGSEGIMEIVKLVKDYRRKVPDNGRPYFASRYLTPRGWKAFNHHSAKEIAFNYLGQYQQLEREGALLRPVEALAGEARGAGGATDVGVDTPRFALFEISAVIIGGSIRFSFTYNQHMNHKDLISKWISACQQNIEQAAATLSHSEPEFTLSDYPLLSLDYQQLKMLQTKLRDVGITKVDAVEDIYPASYIQQGLLISQTRSDSFYAVRVIYKVKASLGYVDTERLARSWRKLVKKHPMLRTVFTDSVGNSGALHDQIVLSYADPDLVQMKCDNESNVVSTLTSKQTPRVENAKRPPHRFTICETSDRNVFCMLEIGHTIMDGASMSVIFRDLALAYMGQLRGIGPFYKDYISYLKLQPIDAGLQYWKSYLKDVEPCHIPILTAGVIDPDRRLRSQRIRFEDLARLQELCNSIGVTLSNAFHAAWALTLRCFIGTPQVCFGYLTSGRDAPVDGIEDMVGPLINMLACRVDMSREIHLDNLLFTIQKDYMESLPYRHTSLAEVQHALKISGSALFNTVLSYRKLPPKEDGQTSIMFEEYVPIYDPTEYNVSINIEASDEDAIIDLDYWTDCASEGQAISIANTFVQALQNIVDNSKLAIGELDYLGKHTFNQILEWNGSMPSTIESCVHDVIKAQMEERPGAAAICGWDRSFTYSELDIAATALAYHLVEAGVRPESLIPTCFEKSAWTIVSMLAVLKAGGACVPLDAKHPRNALEVRVKETQTDIIVCAPQQASIFEGMVSQIIKIDEAFIDALTQKSSRDYSAACQSVRPHNPCFVIFTSGSTGRPKGVVLEHKAMVTSANAHGSALGVGRETRFLQFSSYTFDNSLEEMFTTLMRGGCVCVPSEHDRMNDLAGAINRLQANFMDLTPTVAAFLLPSDVPKIKGMALGGEPLTKKVVEAWKDEVHVHGQYGPAECSINSAWNDNFENLNEVTNIGKAVGCLLWIVDPEDHNYVMPPNCVGELLIEGPILARGYLNDPEKTSKAFIFAPKWAVASENSAEPRRFYKTGDLARHNPNGTITYIGRKDTQTKINGQRVELGEIEYHVKSNLPSTFESAVEVITVIAAGKPTKVLAAFLKEPDSVESVELEEDFILPMSKDISKVSKELEIALTSSIPAYMIPSVFIPVSKMPLTSSGKLDRKQLRERAQTLSDLKKYRLVSQRARKPSTKMEKRLAAIWENVLAMEPDTVGLEDNFFQLGGDSVSAMRLVKLARIEGIAITVASIFQQPTLSLVAENASSIDFLLQDDIVDKPTIPFELLEDQESLPKLIEEVSSLCQVKPECVEDIYPPTAIQEGLIALSTKQTGAYVAQNIFRLSPETDLERFRVAWESIFATESILRTRIVYTNSRGFLQVVVHEPLTWHFESNITASSNSENNLPKYNGAPLSRFSLIDDGTGSPLFVWTVHHAIYDGWSLPLLLKKVEALYKDVTSKEMEASPQFSTFVKYLRRIEPGASDTFWIERLSDANPKQFPHLPHPTPPIRSTAHATRVAEFFRPVGLKYTVATTVRAAWALVVSLFSGSDDVIFGETLTGRDVPVNGIADMIGPTIATIPTRIIVDRELTMEGFLSQVQEQSAEAMEYQHVGIQHIKRVVGGTSTVCGFQNLLSISSEFEEPPPELWTVQSSGTLSTDFYTYPLMLSCTASLEKVEIDVHYDSDIISSWQLQNILLQFATAIEHINNQTFYGSLVGEIMLLSSEDSRKIAAWNREYPDVVDDCIHHIIQQKAALLPPNKVAIHSWDGEFSYQVLDQHTTCLAHYLVSSGITTGTYVPLVFEKSAFTIIAMLGVLKAGAAFSFIDPNAPEARVKEIVADLEADFILCSERYKAFCGDVLKARSIAIDDQLLRSLPSTQNELPLPNPRDAAYVIYTSGSTGKPKGTIVDHLAFSSSAAAHGKALGMDIDSRVLQFASYIFDASILETLTCLSHGGCVCVPDDYSRLHDITGFINNSNVNWALLTPSFVQLLDPKSIPALKKLILGGEAMSRRHISTWLPYVHLMNAYGPSEAAVVATANPKVCSMSDPTDIGHAVGSRAWLVDPLNHNRLVPIGAIGELVVEGPILARGYLKQNSKTAEVFITNPGFISEKPFTPASGQSEYRMYKTGDLVRYNPNGSLVFVGRKEGDHQVKLHGQRLELGEVEYNLSMAPLVKHSLAVIPTKGPCEKRLVAILSLTAPTAGSSDPTVLEAENPDNYISEQTRSQIKAKRSDLILQYLPKVRDYLCDRLPAYMVPSKFVVLEELPLLPSGKLDRRNVSKWIDEMDDETYRLVSEVEVQDTLRRTRASEVEIRLQSIFAEALNLKIDQVGFNQSFFNLGGDSISALAVVARCRVENLGITVQDIVKSRSIPELASRVTLPEKTTYIEEEIDRDFPLSPIQQLFFESMGGKPAHFNQSVLLRINRSISPDELTRAVYTITEAHSMLRTRFSKDSTGIWTQRIISDVLSSFSVKTYNFDTNFDTPKIESLIRESQEGLNIQEGPLFAVNIFVTASEIIVCFVAHHLVIDVVSWRIILEDLQEIIKSGSLQSHRSISFQTWSQLQSECAQKDKTDQLLPLDITPADFIYWGMANESNTYGNVINEEFELNSDISSALIGPYHEKFGTDPVDLFLGSLFHSFRQIFLDRQSSPAIFNEGHGREPWDEKHDLSRTVGWFTTLCPIALPSNAARNASLLDIVRWVKDVRRRIPYKGRSYFAHRQLTEAGKSRFASHWPMEMTFNYLGQFQQMERDDAFFQSAEAILGNSVNSNSDIGDNVPRFALFEISASITQGKVKFTFSYSKNIRRQISIRQWVKQCKTSLIEAADLLTKAEPAPTLSDFPLLPLSFEGVTGIGQKMQEFGIASYDEVEAIYPSSPTQHGILLSQLKNPEYYSYSTVFEVKPTSLDTTIDLPRLVQAWTTVVKRHEALRTIFIDSLADESLMDQLVLKSFMPKVEIVEGLMDLTVILNSTTRMMIRNGCPPHSLKIYKTTQDRIYCKLEISHAISDGTSIPLLFRDLSQAYDGSFITEQETPSYGEFIKYIQQTPSSVNVNYWKAYLTDAEPCHIPKLANIVSDEPRELQTLKLEFGDMAIIQSFCAKNGVTLSNLLQLVWSLVLRCYTGSDDVCFAYLVSGRDVPIQNIHDAIGAFISILVCRINLSNDFPIESALEKIQTDFVQGIAHQHYSLAEIQHELKLSGALFNSAFTYQRRSGHSSLTGLNIEFDILDARDPGEFDVSVNAEATDSAIEISFSYWSDILTQHQANRLSRTFEHILDTIIDPWAEQRVIGDLDFFCDDSSQQVMEWNKDVPIGINKRIQDVIDENASYLPKTAVTSWDGEITYAALREMSGRLADHLVTLGVGPETYVPLCFTKTVWVVVAMLGVLRAGGAFVPLDTNHPPNRLKSLIESLDAKLVLCSHDCYEKITSVADRAFVVDSSAMTSLLKTPSDRDTSLSRRQTNDATFENTAYIIFTSGTTGMPKGTMIQHAAFCTGALGHSKGIRMDRCSRVFQFASYTFDASVMEILTALLVGACVCIPSEEERMNDIPRAISRMAVNWTLLTPSVANTLRPDSVPSLKVLVTGGEAMSADTVTKWADKVCLCNAYGPTETSVIATTGLKLDEKGKLLDADPKNIGRAINGSRCWIVDPRNHNRLMPLDCPGELVVEGQTVARGYLNNEAKTSEAFISNPDWMVSKMQDIKGSNTRMYKTGDLVRYNEDGTFSFIARKDTQIKLRGFRIELSEIEHHLKLSLPEQVQGAIELVSSRKRNKALAAFLCIPENATTSEGIDKSISAAISACDPPIDELLLPLSDSSKRMARNIQTALTKALPSYMVPTLFFPVTRMPWTSSGKLDRNRLRNIIQGLSYEALLAFTLTEVSEKRRPVTETEKKLQVLWEKVLGLEQGSVGADDHFFRLGGDSVSAMRLVAAARGMLISLTVIDIFRLPKLSLMAGVCQKLEGGDFIDPKPFALLQDRQDLHGLITKLASQCHVSHEMVQDAYPCSAIQEGLITLSIKQPGAYVAKNVFRLPDDVEISSFKNAWQKVVNSVDILRTRIVHIGSSSFVQVVLKPIPLLWGEEKSLQDITESSSRLPEHNGGPLATYSIVQSETGPSYFVWSLHHALYDGWSMPMILSQVEEQYYHSASTAAIAPYARFIQYLLRTDPNLSDEFWKMRLSGASPSHFPELVIDKPRKGKTTTYKTKLNGDIIGTEITLSTAIRTAWALIVSAYTGSDDVIFGETLTGRDVPVPGIATDIMGPTLTTVPTRIQINRDWTVEKLLQEVTHTIQEAIPYQHAGLQYIRRLSADAARACEFQNLLVIQNSEESTDISKNSFWKIQDGGLGDFFTHPLVIEINMRGRELQIDAYHDENVISSWAVQQMQQQFCWVLEQMLDKDRRMEQVHQLETTSPEDKVTIQLWNLEQPHVLNQCIHDIFMDLTDLQPSAEAVSAWDGELSYGELRQKAVALAGSLVASGIGPDLLVPICVEKSTVAVVTMLAVLMTGAGFVPLDPSHPVFRHQEVFEETQSRHILCSPQYQDRYRGMIKNIHVVDIPTIHDLAISGSHWTPSITNASNAAYCIFTSGSTGKPKGVVVEHKAFVTSSAAYRESMLMKNTSRVFNFASFTFDVGLMEVLTTLTFGGCVCIPSEESRLADLAESMNILRATWAFLTPSVANMLIPDAVPTLEILVCGGEAMSTENVAKWAEKVTLVNGYGPTEASVIAITNDRVSHDRDPTNIGRAHRGCRAWIADVADYNKLAPVGCVGELLLEGPLLARGYLNMPEKTSEAFIMNPKWAESFSFVSPGDQRLYKTGDLVKYHGADGTINFLGRKDNQIKLAGQRMELGEIESKLEADPRILHALVVLPKAGHFKQRLVAILALNGISQHYKTTSCELISDTEEIGESERQLAEIREAIWSRLPPYMVPSTWVVIKRIPLLVSGKLDRTRVATWVESLDKETARKIAGEQDEDSSTQLNASGTILQDIWARVLNIPVETVKSSSTFLGLGGDSITGMQVMARCRKNGLHISLHELLRSRPLNQLAVAVRLEDEITTSEERTNEEFDLSPIQQLYFDIVEDIQRGGHFNQSTAFRITKSISSYEIGRALEAIVNQHSMLRSRFTQLKSGIWKELITSDVGSSYRYRIHTIKNVSEMIPEIGNTQKSIDALQGPVFAIDLFNIEGSDPVLFLAAHHLVIDVVSWGIILEDLQDMLESGNYSIQKSLSYQKWLRMQADNAHRNASLRSSYFLPFKATPADLNFWGMEGKANIYGDVEYQKFSMDQNISAITLSSCNQALQTDPVDIFLSAIAHSFRRVFPDRESVTIFNEGHGREPWDSNIDLSRTVGWFTSITPVHVPVNLEEDDVFQTVRRIKDARKSVPGKGRPYFAHRFLTAEGKFQFGDHLPMEILFNYLGRTQQLEKDNSLLQKMDYISTPEDAKLTSDVGDTTGRFALFEISASVVDDRIEFTFMYNKNIRRVNDVLRWVQACKQCLGDAAQRLSKARPEPTLSDYPLLPISYEQLQKLTSETFPEIGITHPDQIEDIYPVSTIQEGLLLSQLRDARTYLFHSTFEVKSTIPGARIDARKLANAWQKVVDRHAALRTVFIDTVCQTGVFDQVVVKDAESGVITLECNEGEAEEKMKTILYTQTNYMKKPRLPHQLTVVRSRSGKVYVKLEINHSVIDGISTAIIFQDLAAAYEDRLPSDKGPLYSDYIAYIRSRPPTADVTFWKNYLNGVEPCHFPVLNKRSVPERRHGSVAMSFNRYQELQALCERTKVTLSNVMQAAWAMVLRTFTNSNDVCFGYLTSGRDAPIEGIQTAVGAFINMLVCRVQFGPESSLEQVIQKLQMDYLESLSYQHCSLAQVQHDLNLAGVQLFNTAVSIQNHSKSSDTDISGIIFDPISAHDPSEYPVTINIETTRNEEGLVLQYWTDTISDEQASKVVETLSNILHKMIDAPKETVAALDQPHASAKEETPKDQILPDMESMMRRIVTECVENVIERMFREGSLIQFKPGTNETLGAIQGATDGIQNHAIAAVASSVAQEAGTLKLKPAKQAQKILLVLWRQFLDIPGNTIRPNDSFFQLGGDSITAMQLVAAARDDGLTMTVADIFQHPIFADMVEVVQAATNATAQKTSALHVKRPSIAAPEAPSQEVRPVQYPTIWQSRASAIDSLLQESVIPKIRVFRGGIADIYPVTDFQALAITGTLLEAKWMLNYIVLDGAGSIDISRMRHTVFRLVHAYDILRTVFVPYGDRFMQVVLRRLRPDLAIHDVDGDLEEYTGVLVEEDRRNGPRLGESYVKFVVLRSKQSNQHRIIIRMSHAQYDGVCLPRIITALQLGYEGRPIPPTPGFSNYIRDCRAKTSQSHYDHWSTLLAGSEMTNIVNRMEPNYGYSASATTNLKQSIHLTSLSKMYNITPATLIKAAWALVLAQLASRRDVVFGNVISGRNASVPGIDSIVGPCLNLVPVRIRFRDGLQAIDLLKLVQDQQVSNIPYETLGFREMIRTCTDWPAWTNFSSVVQHQNIDRETHIRLGDIQYSLSALGSQENLSDITIVSTPRGYTKDGREEIEIALGFIKNSMVRPDFAQALLDELCDTCVSFCENPTALLPSPTSIEAEIPQTLMEDPRQAVPLSVGHLLTHSDLSSASDAVTRAWQAVLRDQHGNTPPITADMPFWDLGGDIMALAHVTHALREREGCNDLKVEDLIDRPLFREQVELIAVLVRDYQILQQQQRRASEETIIGDADERGVMMAGAIEKRTANVEQPDPNKQAVGKILGFANKLSFMRFVGSGRRRARA